MDGASKGPPGPPVPPLWLRERRTYSFTGVQMGQDAF
jgi:hypothetical protein